MQRIEDGLYELTSEFVSDMGFKLVDVREVREYGRRVFKFCIDSARGISLADCESVSRELAYFLDAEGEIEGAYLLEVTSPGLDRDLVKEREYEHFAGQRVRLVLRGGGADGIMAGTIVSAQRGILTFRPDGAEEVEIPLASIARARLETEVL
jgi:ribosome maturation factor RimP